MYLGVPCGRNSVSSVMSESSRAGGLRRRKLRQGMNIAAMESPHRSRKSIVHRPHEHHCTFCNCCSETARWNHGACKHAQRAVPYALPLVVCLAACCQCTGRHVQDSIAMLASPSGPCNKHLRNG